VSCQWLGALLTRSIRETSPGGLLWVTGLAWDACGGVGLYDNDNQQYGVERLLVQHQQFWVNAVAVDWHHKRKGSCRLWGKG